MYSLRELERNAPDVHWVEPLEWADSNGENYLLCRICTANVGLLHGHHWPQGPAEFRRHLEETHGIYSQSPLRSRP